MKRKLLLLAMVLPALALLVAQNYKLLIRTSEGKEISVKTSEIEKMEFVEDTTDPDPGPDPDPGTDPDPKPELPDPIPSDNPNQLAQPVPVVTISNDTYTVEWAPVPNAKSYSWYCNMSSSWTDECSYTFTNLEPGEYEFRVRANATNSLMESEFGRVKFTVTRVHEAGSITQAVIDNFTHNKIRVLYFPNNNNTMTAAAIPASEVSDDASILSYVNSLSADLKFSFSDRKTNTFTGLQPATKYIVAVIDGTEVVAKREVTTESTPSTGTTGTIFAPGVTKTSGFIDVDKVGNTKYGDDSPLCWACATSAMCQWWLNDYKATTGEDFKTKYPLQTESEYYSTPIMDMFMQAWTIQAGNPGPALQWFFAGFEYPESYFVNDLPAFQLSYRYVKGGFINMTVDEFARYHKEYNQLDLFRGMSQAQVKTEFGDRLIGWLRNGPVYFDIAGVHALLIWGADYVVTANGSKEITKLHYVENDHIASNLKNSLQEAEVGYTNNAASLNYPYIITGAGTGSGSHNGKITNLVPLRSWSAVNGK